MTPDERSVIDIVKEELVVPVVKRLDAMNGTVGRHNEEIFGDEDKGTVGLRPEMNDMHDLVIQAKATVRTLLYLVGFLGATNLIALITVAVRT